MDFAGKALALDQGSFDAVAAQLGTGAAEIWAVLDVETSGCGFFSDRRPLILFERHVFSKRTKRMYDQQHPDISNAQPGGYRGGAAEYGRLAAAIALNRNAALESTSWGIGQIMGFNAAAAGYADAEALVAASMESEGNQLGAMAQFLATNKLVAALRTRDWANFARGYNGPAYAKNRYDGNLSGAFAKYSVGALPDLTVRAAQLYLGYLGYQPGPVDGWLGKRTRSALSAFQGDNDLSASGAADKATMLKLRTMIA